MELFLGTKTLSLEHGEIKTGTLLSVLSNESLLENVEALGKKTTWPHLSLKNKSYF